MTEIGFIIQPGQPIPDDVTGVVDTDGDAWRQTPRGHWHLRLLGEECEAAAECPQSGLAPGSETYGPLTVTAVREQPAELEPDVLDLVRQWGDARCLMGIGRDYAANTEAAGALFARIEAEVQRLRDERDDARRLLGVVEGQCDEHHAEVGRLTGVVERLNAEAERVTDELVKARDERDAARADVERLEAQMVKEARVYLDTVDKLTAELERLKAAQPDPRVLSLPQVPEGAVALIGARSGRRFVKAPAPEMSRYWYIEATAEPLRWDYPHKLHDLLFVEGSVTVVMREPRTWPRLDGAPDDLMTFEGASGRRYVFCLTGPSGVRHYKPTGQGASAARPVWYWQGVDGPLVEVFDDEDGTR